MRKAALTLLSLFFIGNLTGFAQTPGEDEPGDLPVMDYSTPRPYIINEVKVLGVKYLDTDILTASAGLRKGDTVYIPGNNISQAVSRLWNQRYFSDVKVVVEMIDDNHVNLEIYLQERPRVYNWNFEGIRNGEITTLKDELKLKRGTELSDYGIDKNKEAIRKHFSDKGFRNTEVTTRIENDAVMQNAVNVTFVINKNKKVRIGEINFDGNEEFSDGRLRRTMKKTHQTSVLFYQNTKLNDSEFENDKENVIDFYNSQGYRNAVIVKDSMYVINDRRIGINITLEEGNKFYLRNVNWIGNTLFSTEYLQGIFALEKGDAYDKKTINKRLGVGKEEDPDDMAQIKSMYQNEGYLMSMIDPSEIVVGADSIDLEIKIFEGRPFTINNVNISGNMRVNDEVVRREIHTRPGELYNRALIMQTMRQLAQMQHFDVYSLMPGINPVSNDLVDISWPLNETPSDKVEISGGWGSGTFVGSVGLQLNNFSVRNIFQKGAWRPYPQGQNQQLLIRANSNGSYYKSFVFSFTEPWLGGKKPNSLTLSAHYSEETNAYTFGGVFTKATKHFRTTGIAAGIGRRLSSPDPYFTLYNEIGFTSYHLKDWQNYFAFSDGRSNQITLRTVLARNTVNDPIYPSHGSEFSLSLTLTPPYSLFDGKDYRNMDSDDINRYKWVEYHKWMGKATWYYPISSDQKLVLMTRAELGYLGYYNKYKLSPFEGFDVGGDGMSGYNLYGVDVIGLRGYEDSTLTPRASGEYGTYANVYNKYTVEVRYPFIRQSGTQVYGLVFAEAGNGFRSWQEFDPFQLKRSAGVGIRIYLNIIGMIGFDYGFGFDKTATGEAAPSNGKFHFSMGMQF